MNLAFGLLMRNTKCLKHRALQRPDSGPRWAQEVFLRGQERYENPCSQEVDSSSGLRDEARG